VQHHTQFLFLEKHFLFHTVHAIIAMDKPTVNAPDRVLFIASLLPQEIIKRHLRHRNTASGTEKIGKFRVLSFPVRFDGQFVTNPSVKCPHTFQFSRRRVLDITHAGNTIPGRHKHTHCIMKTEKEFKREEEHNHKKITRSVLDSPSLFFDFGTFVGHEAPHRTPTVITEEPESSLNSTSTSCRVHAYEHGSDPWIIHRSVIASTFAAAAPLWEGGQITTGVACSPRTYTLSCLSIIAAGTAPKFWFL
jgi:hypothetical protein